MLAGRVVIVTGGGRGIGRSHCLELAAHGATVVVNDLGVGVGGDDSADDPGAEVVAAIEAAGGTASTNGASVSDYAAVRDLVESTISTYGRLDAIVNNAGIARDKTITSMTEADFDAVIAVHLKGTFNLTKHACDYWRAESKAGRTPTARIVNTTSGTGLAGNVGQFTYGAAKAAIANVTMTTAMEGSRYGVTANCISPLAATRMSAAIGWERAEGSFDRLDPANSSPVVAWLCSEQSGWVTGRVLRIDGGTVYPVKPWSVEAGYSSNSGERLDATEIDAGLRGVFGLFPPGLAGLQPPAGS
ncbi:MAG: putative oxidoreductase, short-chain dehydrogenase/reductase family [Aeromicrobium sp.]|nr:putative oxidoreductase, short-chain dehydrogenase/reductase family [Aeromicrobium sp.]